MGMRGERNILSLGRNSSTNLITRECIVNCLYINISIHLALPSQDQCQPFHVNSKENIEFYYKSILSHWCVVHVLVRGCATFLTLMLLTYVKGTFVF